MVKRWKKNKVRESKIREKGIFFSKTENDSFTVEQ